MPSTALAPFLPTASPFPTPQPEASSSRPHPRTLLSSELLPHLSTLQSLESALSQDLHALLSDRTAIDSAHTRLHQLLPRIELVESEVNGVNGTGDDAGLVQRIGKVNEIAERIGGKVRDLDLELLRVKEASERLNEVMELKASLETLRSSIRSKDWETAARACKRAMSIPQDIIEGGFASRVVPTADDPSPPSQALQALRSELLSVFQSNFSIAATARDEVATSRFFRLWPEIGAESEGLQAYGDFVVSLVRGRNMSVGKTSSPLYYITHLTALFESIGLIVDQHQPVVEKYYGPGRMQAVVGRLQEEGDRVLEGLVSGWEEERRVARTLLTTQISPVSKALSPPAPLPSSLSSANLSSLPSAASSLLNTYSAARRAGPAPVVPSPFAEEDTGPDPREIDKVLVELTAMAGRWGLYRRFLWGRLQEVPPSPPPGSPLPPPRGFEPQEGESAKEDPVDIVEQSLSMSIIQTALRKYYEPMEIWYLRTSIDKALRLDTPDTTSRPHLSSAPDDTFYLLKVVLYRLVTSSSLPTLQRMIALVSEAIETDYLGGIKRKMDGVYTGVRNAGAALATQGGQSKGGEAERMEREMRGSFVIYANDLDVSAEHMNRLMDEILTSDVIGQAFLSEEVDRARQEIKSLSSLSDKCKSTLKTSIDQLFNQLVRPRIRPFLDECYKGVTYNLDEDSYAEADFQDTVRKRFVRSWNNLVDGYRVSFSDANYSMFFAMTVDVLVRPWEKLLLSMKFTELGALRLDRDIRSIANFLSTQTSFGGSREKFIRLQQISTVLNLGPDEDPKEFYSQSGMPWRLSRTEYDGVCALRI